MDDRRKTRQLLKNINLDKLFAKTSLNSAHPVSKKQVVMV
jgi:hypothetical protein